MKLVVVLVIAVLGCGKEEQGDKRAPGPAKGPPAPRAEPRDLIEARYGLVIDVPPDAKPTQIESYQTDDKSFAVLVQEIGPTPTHADAAAFKATTFKYTTLEKVIDEQTLPDGWYLAFAWRTGDDAPVEYALHMVRQIDGTYYKCTCILPKPDRLAEVVAACKSLRKKP